MWALRGLGELSVENRVAFKGNSLAFWSNFAVLVRGHYTHPITIVIFLTKSRSICELSDIDILIISRENTQILLPLTEDSDPRKLPFFRPCRKIRLHIQDSHLPISKHRMSSPKKTISTWTDVNNVQAFLEILENLILVRRIFHDLHCRSLADKIS